MVQTISTPELLISIFFSGQLITFSSLILSPVIATLTFPGYSDFNIIVTVVPLTETNPIFIWPKEETTPFVPYDIFPNESPVDKIKGLPPNLQFIFPSIS